MSTFLLEIVTPERIVFSEQVESLSVRGEEGELGILPGHIPFVTPLKVAPITIKSAKQSTTLAVHGGFVEVQKDKVILLAESAEKSTDIDVERAIAARERAERRLSSSGKQDLIDHRRAELALQRAITRINVSTRSKE
ncbi:F0F1 ATP synthase subunit epsilon [Paenibacillus sp. YPG26]|uniref:F0F1 ATP synthase subunit epsilon n=1 Tax=Paenibacillus sp. YPG26 TaxID=2878915 RepID=UPI00203A9FF5|nr:F0F1 ATP synthase subunit epsilon [Paenibacillus sp. YPG26]USB32880.1 F0F1 ATP synthase subunit epsilon [Paenibacillus sp. YPG26]